MDTLHDDFARERILNLEAIVEELVKQLKQADEYNKALREMYDEVLAKLALWQD